MKDRSLNGHMKRQKELAKADLSPAMVELGAGGGDASFFLLSN